MRYAVISDIHGNLEALMAVLQECQNLRVENFLCIGDIVGYGANPKECLDLVRKMKAKTVAGNHDWAVSGRLDASYFTEDGKAAIFWTRNKVTFEDIASLHSLPMVYKDQDFLMVHGTLHEPEMFHYLFKIDESVSTFDLMDRPVCFVGHTHVPVIFIESKGRVYRAPSAEIEIKQDCRYIVNVGSVGQPRDGNPLASFCIFDTKAQMIEIRRVQYDISSAQKKILEAGLPKALAERLASGG